MRKYPARGIVTLDQSANRLEAEQTRLEKQQTKTKAQRRSTQSGWHDMVDVCDGWLAAEASRSSFG